MVKSLIHIEGAVICAISLYLLFAHLQVSWWLLPVFILGPDASMIGYAFNPRIGSILYNIFHTLILALTLTLIGWLTTNQPTLIAGLILTGHIGMDRAFGYGLKYPTNFKDTHLSRI